MEKNKYSDYFDIDDHYFPAIDDSAIKSDPGCWTKTYPHETFIEMLEKMEKILTGAPKVSLWIEGAFGTGKSQCAYSLKKILEVPEEDVRKYWNKHDDLRKKPDLLEKLIGHKKRGILSVYRYGSGSINSSRDLFFAIQESVKNALKEKGLYTGENSLKEAVIDWIDKPVNKKY